MEVPIVSYRRFPNGQIVLDERVRTTGDEEKCKEAIFKHSPFKNDLSIGAQFAKIENTGTRIFIYNLEQWDGKCIFDWNPKQVIKIEAPAEKKVSGDIIIRSKRVRVRAGQTSNQVSHLTSNIGTEACLENMFVVYRTKHCIQVFHACYYSA